MGESYAAHVLQSFVSQKDTAAEWDHAGWNLSNFHPSSRERAALVEVAGMFNPAFCKNWSHLFLFFFFLNARPVLTWGLVCPCFFFFCMVSIILFKHSGWVILCLFAHLGCLLTWTDTNSFGHTSLPFSIFSLPFWRLYRWRVFVLGAVF